jgi:hypothetical protein
MTKSNRRDEVQAGSRRFDFDPSIRKAEHRLDFVPAEKSRRCRCTRTALRRTPHLFDIVECTTPHRFADVDVDVDADICFAEMRTPALRMHPLFL